VQVREASFDDPALTAEMGSVLDAAASDQRLDAPGPEQSAVLVVVVTTVGEHEVGLLSRPSEFAGDRPRVEVLKQRDQLRDVVAIAAGQRDGQRDPGGINEKMVL